MLPELITFGHIHTTRPPNITLLRLVINNRDLFYPQDWYCDEEFANVPMRLNGRVFSSYEQDGPMPTAVECAWDYVCGSGSGRSEFWRENYVWTSDRDDGGHRVYVGGCGRGKLGFQIHRHLDNPIALTMRCTA